MYKYCYIREILNDGKAGFVVHMVDVTESWYHNARKMSALADRWLEVWYKGDMKDSCRYGSYNEHEHSHQLNTIAHGVECLYPEIRCYDSVEEFFAAIKYDYKASDRSVIKFANGEKFTSANGNQKGNM